MTLQLQKLVLVDGLDVSDDKMLQGRTFYYSDTQRHRVGTNYLQLPINALKKQVATNQRDGQIAYKVDAAPGQNLHVNYEPSLLNGLKEAPKAGKDHMSRYEANLICEKIDRQNNFKQAGERYRMFAEWKEMTWLPTWLIHLNQLKKLSRIKWLKLLTNCDADYGRRVVEGFAECQ